jgi:hypothetical protein
VLSPPASLQISPLKQVADYRLKASETFLLNGREQPGDRTTLLNGLPQKHPQVSPDSDSVLSEANDHEENNVGGSWGSEDKEQTGNESRTAASSTNGSKPVRDGDADARRIPHRLDGAGARV